ncbi:MAG: N-acetyltransferase family protein [Bacillota bacterium]
MAALFPQRYNIKDGEIKIEPAAEDDAAELLEYLEQTHTETDYLLREPEELDMTVEDEKDFINNMNESDIKLFLVARKDDMIVGNIGFMGSPHKRYKHQGEFGLSVLQDYWGLGIGGCLLEALFSWAEQNEIIRISLRVDTENHRAINLYKKYDFVEEGVLEKKKRLAEDEFVDEMVMAKFF